LIARIALHLSYSDLTTPDFENNLFQHTTLTARVKKER